MTRPILTWAQTKWEKTKQRASSYAPGKDEVVLLELTKVLMVPKKLGRDYINWGEA